MSKRQLLERVVEIDRQIRSRRCPTIGSLAEEMEVSSRTIHYDLSFLRERLDAPLEFSKERGGYVYTDPSWVLPSTYVSEGELLAFFLSVEVAQRYLGTAFEGPLRSAVSKIGAGLKSRVWVDLRELCSYYTIAGPNASVVEPQLLLDLHRAIRERLQIRMRYFTAGRGEWNERTVDPYHLYNLRGEWYLVAYDHLRGQLRNFYIIRERVEWWKVLNQRFTRREDFSPEEWMQRAFAAERGERPQQVTIRFDTYQARWIRERSWHETQEIEDLPDGGCLLRFVAGGLDEVKRWVMGYGGHAEVLEPEELREGVKEEVGRMEGVYGVSGGKARGER